MEIDDDKKTEEPHDPLAFLNDDYEEPEQEVTTPTVEEKEVKEEIKAPEKVVKKDDDDEEVTPDEKGMVPHGALHAAREKAKAKQSALQAEIDALKAAGTKPEVKADETVDEEFVPPDPAKDPVGYAKYMDQRIEINTLNTNLNFSERFARKEHGNEKVDEAFAWFQSMAPQYPDVYNKTIRSQDPYGEMMSMYANVKQTEELREIDPDKLAAFRAWEAANAKVSTDDKSQKTQPDDKSTKKTPPKSIASGSTDGGKKEPEGDTGPGVAFGNAFN